MKKKTFVLVVCTICLMLTTGLVGGAVAADLPAPGTVINKANIDQYKDLFPEFWLDAFATGYGFIKPLSIVINDGHTNNPMPKPFMDATKLNKGKYSIDAEGYITGGPYEDIVGYPFPELDPADPQYVHKIMWNYDYKYNFDDQKSKFMNFEKRIGSNVSISEVESFQVSFQSRMYMDPKPLYETAQGYRSANLIRNMAPPVQRNFITLLIRYIDQKASDTTYLYLPSMRRVLRGEAGERSTPIMSSTQAPDDFNGGFAGRIPEFTYELVEETQVIGQSRPTWNYSAMIKKDEKEYIPVEPEGWEVRDVWVIDILPKNEKYPQSRKRIWLDKQTMINLYACAWDRAGKLWKIWQCPHKPYPNSAAPGETIPYYPGMLGLDLQLGYGTQMFADWTMNGVGVTDADISVAALRKLGR